MIRTPHEILSGNQIKNNKMAGTCAKYGRYERYFWWRKLKERDNLDDLGVDRRRVFKSILNRLGRRGLDCSVSE
jgi:hypothetical protein